MFIFKREGQEVLPIVFFKALGLAENI